MYVKSLGKVKLGRKEIQAHKESPKALYAVGKYSKNIFRGWIITVAFRRSSDIYVNSAETSAPFRTSSSENKRT